MSNDLFTDAQIAYLKTIFETKKTAAPAGDFWETLEFFKKLEFRCTCGGRYCNGYPAEVSENLAKTLNYIRRESGRPVTIISGLRCDRRNADVGGVINSDHKNGHAADFSITGLSDSATMALVKSLGVKYTDLHANGGSVHISVYDRKEEHE